MTLAIPCFNAIIFNVQEIDKKLSFHKSFIIARNFINPQDHKLCAWGKRPTFSLTNLQYNSFLHKPHTDLYR